MKHLSRLHSLWISFDYGLLLPLLARLPLSWGRSAAAFRGRLYGTLGRDWRQFSFEDNTLYQRTAQTLQLLLPDADDATLKQAISQRYQMQSIEEWEAACLIIGRDITALPIIYEGIDSVLTLLENKPSTVFLTAHFGSSILGTVFLQRLGIPILGMSSNVVDAPSVHPMISRFYRQKYAAMGHYLNGGKILDKEGNLGKFYRFLKNSGGVVIVGDLPPGSNQQAIIRPFLGAHRGFAAGAVKLSTIADAPLLAFVCEYRDKQYHLRFSNPDEDPYAFLDQAIRDYPSNWWAADLLSLLPETSS